ncbi:MAG: PEP-CTERM sorting domain-containing protein, partial [Proteobacteria bacterium]|nr:PEP-CTERM sorting domain-containing protein [Pseudomonadota bacterium]
NWFLADESALPSPATNGEKTIGVNAITSGIAFTAPGLLIQGQNHEFSLKDIEYTAVPEPTTLLLLGLGLIGVAYVRRTLKK